MNFYRWCEAADEGTYYYIKSIMADDGCVYLECDGGDASNICGDYRYFDALVLVHFLRKMDPSFELRLYEKVSFGGYYGNHETVIDINVDLTDEACLEYDESDDICISLPEDLNEDDEDE